MNIYYPIALLLLAPIHSFGSFDVSDEFIYSMVWEPESPEQVDITLKFSIFVFLQSENANSMIIKTLNNETYKCHLPTVTRGKSVPESPDSDKPPHSLLANMFEATPCIFKVEGYWTYELCHGKHIRQFRAEGTGPKTTRIVKEFYLGLATDQTVPSKHGDSKKSSSEDKADESTESKPVRFAVNIRLAND